MERLKQDQQETPPLARGNRGEPSSAVDVCNRYLFQATVGLLVLEFIGCFLQRQVMQAGIPIQTRPRDIPLLLGLLVMTVGIFNFYEKLIKPFGELPAASLHSLFGMVATTSLPILLFFEGLAPFRYCILSAYGAIVVLKNYQLRCRFWASRLGLHYAVWERQATAQTLAALSGGIIFYYLMEPARRGQLLALVYPTSPPLWRYDETLTLLFGIGFVLVALGLFFSNENKLSSDSFMLNEVQGSDRIGVPSLCQTHRWQTAIIAIEFRQLLMHVYAYCYLIRVFSSLNGALFVYLLATRSTNASPMKAVLAAAATFAAIAAGFSLNDALDVREDRLNNKSRPVAEGIITARSAIYVYVFFTLLALLVCVFIHMILSLGIVVLMLALVLAYSRYLKRIWFVKNLVVAVTITMMPILVQSLADTGKNLLPICVVTFLWAWQKEVLFDVRDMDGDQSAGVITPPIRLGRNVSATAVLLANLGFWIWLLPFIRETVRTSAPIWALGIWIHTSLVWYLAGKSSTGWVRAYVSMQSVLTTIVLFGFLL